MEPVSREPVELEMDGLTFFFYCRRFTNKEHSEQVYRRLVDETEGTGCSAVWVRELEFEASWAIIFFAEDYLTLITIDPFIRDYGEPFLSDFMFEAARRRIAALASEKLIERFGTSFNDATINRLI